jgi:TctA family transporter
LNISLGDWSVLWTRPISQILIILVALVIAYPMVRAYRNKVVVSSTN